MSTNSVNDTRKAICPSMIWILFQMIDLLESELGRLCIGKIGMDLLIFCRKGFLRPIIPFHLLVFGMLILDSTNHKLDASLETFSNMRCMSESTFKLI